MKLLVIVLCLLSERFLIHGISYQRFSWFGDYCTTILEKLSGNKFLLNPWARLAALVLPIVFIVSFIYFLFHGILFGFVGLVLSIFIFLYCLGPQNAFYPLSQTDPETSGNERVGSYFAATNGQLFAVLFWYLVGGPIAVLTYRLITLCRQEESITVEANQLTDLLEWMPARLTVLLFLLVGNFQTGFTLFSKNFLSKPKENNQLVSECGIEAAKTQESDEEIPMPAAERLVEHATIVLLVFVALLILGTSI